METAAVKRNNRFTLKIINDDMASSPREWDNLGKMVCWHRRYNFGDKHDFDNHKEFLADLVIKNLSAKDIISYVKDGKAKGLTLEYNKSNREWELMLNEDYFKKPYSVHTADAPLDMNSNWLAETILDEMRTDDLLELAGQKAEVRALFLYDHSIQSISMRSFVGRAQHAEWDSGQVGYVYVTHEDIKKEYGDVSTANIEKAERLLESEVETYDHYIRGECYGFQLCNKKGEEIDSCWGFIGDFNDVKKEISEYLPKEAKKLAENAEYGDDDTKKTSRKPSLLKQVKDNQEKIKAQSGNEINTKKIVTALE